MVIKEIILSFEKLVVNRILYVSCFVTLLFFRSSPVYASILLNEILPDPSGPQSEETEFIELYNTESTDVSLDNWVLDDITSGGSSPYTIPQGTIISGNNFLVFLKKDTGVTLNNSGDTVQLLDSYGSAKDTYTYSASFEDISFGRSTDGGGTWTKCIEVTQGRPNICPIPTATFTPSPKPSSTPKVTSTPKPTPTPTPSPKFTPTRTPTQTIQTTQSYVSTTREDETDLSYYESGSIENNYKVNNGISNKSNDGNLLYENGIEETEASGSVLGETGEKGATESDLLLESTKSMDFEPLIISLIFVGAGCAVFSIVFILKKMIRQKLKENL